MPMKLKEEFDSKVSETKKQLTDSINSGNSDKLLIGVKSILTSIIKLPASMCSLLSINLILASDSSKHSMFRTAVIIDVVVALVFLSDFFLMSNNDSLMLALLTPLFCIIYKRLFSRRKFRESRAHAPTRMPSHAPQAPTRAASSEADSPTKQPTNHPAKEQNSDDTDSEDFYI